MSFRTMASLVSKLLARLVGGVLLLATGAFILVQAMPGDPVARLLGPGASQVDVTRARQALGLNHPILERYRDLLGGVFTLRFGDSFTGQSVSSILADRTLKTAELAACSVLVTAILSVVIGLVMAAATKNESRSSLASIFTTLTGLLSAIPSYVLAMGLVALLSVRFPIFPVSDPGSPSGLVLPVAALSVPAVAILSRIVRVEALSALQSEYVKTARSKQLPPVSIYFRHVLPNVITGALTIGGVWFGYMLGGSVIVENVFQWPGLGTALVSATDTRDYPVLQATIILVGIGVLLVNTVVDLILVALNPRLRVSR